MRRTSNSILSALWLASCAAAAEAPVSTLIDAPPAPPPNSFTPWPSQVPADCPYPQSEVVNSWITADQAYLNNFGEQAYFVNIPSKFIGGDGRTLWLCYSANFSSGWGGTTFESRPPGSRYTMCLQEVRLLAPTDPVPAPSPLTAADNIAPRATVTVSSTYPDHETTH